MTDENQQSRDPAGGTRPTPQAPVPGEAGASRGSAGPGETPPPAPAPLTPTVLVWPGRTFAQTWIFMWVGVAFVIGALLPWHGPDERVLTFDRGAGSSPRFESLTRKQLEHRAVLREAGADVEAALLDPVEVKEPEGVWPGALVVLFMGLGLALTGLTNIWMRKLTFWPVVMAVFVVLTVLYFTTTEVLTGSTRLEEVNAFSNGVAVMGSVIDWIGADPRAEAAAELEAVSSRFGLGLYLSLVAWVAMVAVILGSMVLAALTARKDQQPASASPARRGRSGSRR